MMIMRTFFISLIFCLTWGHALAFTPTSDYEQRNIKGWRIYISPDYEEAQKAAMLEVLTQQLHGIARVIPAKALSHLRDIAIWVELKPDTNSAGAFRVNKSWIKANNRNPDKHRNVVMNYNVVRWKDFQPWIVLHELAHAYHFQVIGTDNQRIIESYDKAVKSGLLDRVQRKDGSFWRAYALTNYIEYFAEVTESYFGENDDQPFNREALKRTNPDGVRMVEEIWFR